MASWEKYDQGRISGIRFIYELLTHTTNFAAPILWGTAEVATGTALMPPRIEQYSFRLPRGLDWMATGNCSETNTVIIYDLNET